MMVKGGYERGFVSLVLAGGFGIEIVALLGVSLSVAGEASLVSAGLLVWFGGSAGWFRIVGASDYATVALCSAGDV